ncbi:MAG: SGNH/GDSL hydrolase family protein [Bacteroidota bacterium]
MSRLKNKLVPLGVLILFSAGSCTQTAPTGPVAGLGSVPVTKYVAIGNSLTAGYQSNALYASSQSYSYPSLIARQLRTAGANLGTFEQPLVSDPGTPDTAGGTAARLEILGFSGSLPLVGSRSVAAGTALNAALARPYDNLGIPYAPLLSFLDTTNAFPGALGFFTNHVLRPGGTLPKSVFQQVVALQPDLITFWLGNNDVLGFATSGGVSPSSPTDAGVFAAQYALALDTLRSALPNARILVGNIPDVTSIPFFTTVGPYLQSVGITQAWGIHSTGDTLLMSLQTNLLTLLAQSSFASGKGLARLNPLPNHVILDATEIATAQAAVTAFNNIIAAAAAQNSALLFDANTLLKRVQQDGYFIAGEVFTSDYLLGGLFSLDGVHPSSRGYGIVANEMLRTMNGGFGMNIPFADVSEIPGIPVPLLKGVLPRIEADAFEHFHLLFSPHR